MNSLFRGLIERVSSSMKAQATVASATTPPVLGRWGIHYDERIIARKIVQANEDNCGCCRDGDIAENLKNKQAGEGAAKKKNRVVTQYEKTEEYLVPYVM
jgi:hypothetical protein